MKGIEIPIGAPLGQLDSDLKGAKSKLSAFTADQVKAAGGLDAFKRAANSGGQSLQNFAKGTNSANFALTNFGRVAQDAPFGFIGIQNNLNPLLESFQRLKAETGSTGGAFKALGASLLGPAGIGIALSVVSAGILLYQQYQQKANKTTENAKKVNDDYAKSLGDVAQAQLVGAQSAASELTNLKVLYGQTQNTTLSLKQRIAASDELQSKYPAYFKNISDEAILAGGAAAKYNELSTAILASARARAGQDLITTNTKRQLENEQKIIDLTKAQIKVQQDATRAKSIANASIGAAGSDMGSTGSITATNNEIKAAKDLKNIQDQIRNIKTDSSKLDERNLQLIKSINIESAKGTVLDGKTAGGAATQKISSGFSGSQKNQIDTQKRFAEIMAQGKAFEGKLIIDQIERNADKEVEATKKAFDEIEALNVSLGKITLDPFSKDFSTKIAEPLKDGIKTMSFELFRFNDMATNIIGGALTDTFSGIGEAIGNALSTGANLASSIGSVLLSTLGSVLGQLGQMAIATGVALLGITTALKTLNPFVAIAAGVALLALSGVVRGATAKIGSNMGGGSSGGSVSVPAQSNSYSPSSSSSGSNSDFGGGRVVFEISGTNLIGVLNRAGAKLQRFGP